MDFQLLMLSLIHFQTSLTQESSGQIAVQSKKLEINLIAVLVGLSVLLKLSLIDGAFTVKANIRTEFHLKTY